MENMYNNPPDYSRYTIEELEDVLDNIDKEQFPERYIEAKAMLCAKMKEQAREPNSDNARASPPLPKIKWSEQLLITRIVMSLFLVMIFSGVPTVCYEFMPAKSWTTNTTKLIWGLASILVIMWFACLKKDPKLKKRLGETWGGKLAIVIMPFLFMMMSWLFIDESLPLGLHMISAQQEVRYDMDYQKKRGKKYCRQRVEIIETEELEHGDLCMTESQRDSLPKRGKIDVVGIRSQYGMVIHGFRLP